MDRQRVYLGLRIAASGFFGILCVLLIVLWVRSYDNCDIATFGFSTGPGYMVGSEFGSLLMFHHPLRTGHVSEGWHAWSMSVDPTPNSNFRPATYGGFGFKLFPEGTSIAVAPNWFFVLLSAALAFVPWMKWRFSLRTLLIATTLIALVLGLVVAVKG